MVSGQKRFLNDSFLKTMSEEMSSVQTVAVLYHGLTVKKLKKNVWAHGLCPQTKKPTEVNEN